MATNQVFVYTMNRGGLQGSWSRYIFPFNIEHFSHLGSSLYMRHGDIVSYTLENHLSDNGATFGATIQWPWLDFGQPGVNKMLIGFDIVVTGTCNIEVGYDQNNLSAFTAAEDVPVDTWPGQIIPLICNSPTMSVRLNFDPGQAWQWNALNVYLEDMRVTS